MKFSVLSWNVESFKGTPAQLASVATHITALNPDVFGIFEVEKVDIVALITQHLPGYDYNVTDGPENKEILVAVRKGKFEHSIFTQKREFKSYNPALRPGAMLNLWLGETIYNILFLHTDAGTNAASFGNRNEMFDKIWKVKHALDKLPPQDPAGSRLIALGDMNTMGLRFPGQTKKYTRVPEDEEIAILAAVAQQEGMTRLPKEFEKTYNNGRVTSNLDHVLATTNLAFNPLGKDADGKTFYVRVTGWQQLSGAARKTFINTISDHCSLYCEVM